MEVEKSNNSDWSIFSCVQIHTVTEPTNTKKNEQLFLNFPWLKPKKQYVNFSSPDVPNRGLILIPVKSIDKSINMQINQKSKYGKQSTLGVLEIDIRNDNGRGWISRPLNGVTTLQRSKRGDSKACTLSFTVKYQASGQENAPITPSKLSTTLDESYLNSSFLSTDSDNTPPAYVVYLQLFSLQDIPDERNFFFSKKDWKIQIQIFHPDCIMSSHSKDLISSPAATLSTPMSSADKKLSKLPNLSIPTVSTQEDEHLDRSIELSNNSFSRKNSLNLSFTNKGGETPRAPNTRVDESRNGVDKSTTSKKSTEKRKGKQSPNSSSHKANTGEKSPKTPTPKKKLVVLDRNTIPDGDFIMGETELLIPYTPQHESVTGNALANTVGSTTKMNRDVFMMGDEDDEEQNGFIFGMKDTEAEAEEEQEEDDEEEEEEAVDEEEYEDEENDDDDKPRANGNTGTVPEISRMRGPGGQSRGTLGQTQAQVHVHAAVEEERMMPWKPEQHSRPLNSTSNEFHHYHSFRTQSLDNQSFVEFPRPTSTFYGNVATGNSSPKKFTQELHHTPSWLISEASNTQPLPPYVVDNEHVMLQPEKTYSPPQQQGIDHKKYSSSMIQSFPAAPPTPLTPVTSSKPHKPGNPSPTTTTNTREHKSVSPSHQGSMLKLTTPEEHAALRMKVHPLRSGADEDEQPEYSPEHSPRQRQQHHHAHSPRQRQESIEEENLSAVSSLSGSSTGSEFLSPSSSPLQLQQVKVSYPIRNTNSSSPASPLRSSHHNTAVSTPNSPDVSDPYRNKRLSTTSMSPFANYAAAISAASSVSKASHSHSHTPSQTHSHAQSHAHSQQAHVHAHALQHHRSAPTMTYASRQRGYGGATSSSPTSRHHTGAASSSPPKRIPQRHHSVSTPSPTQYHHHHPTSASNTGPAVHDNYRWLA